ncbi:ABC transporter ATP-binding protein [Paenibacillus campi]|uniref:ABC transporter ATP-binding protein n=1 Tax=Paenibacillus campi TaxID=3106031 RepID=UPI002AFE17C0|nr:ABC transporter ATP-binding protein [Paenibacillus sp. SGZ-1014]
MIRLNGLEIHFNHKAVIQNLSLDIQKGEFFTFLGPSGCGKTTTLKAITGFITPTKGSIQVNGNDITYLPVEERNIGMVFQNYALFPTMTVQENIIFGLKEHKWSKDRIRARLEQVAQMVNLTAEQLRKQVTELSGGQQQRVAIARTLALKPDIIVLDEPLSNLDAKLRKKLRSELKRIQAASGVTMIYVTHDQEEALTLSDRIAVFNEGAIEQVGTPYDIYYQPTSEFVVDFIGEANRLQPSILTKLSECNADFNVQPQQRVYVRSEHIKQHIAAAVLDDYYVLDAQFESEEFYGLHVKRIFKVAGEPLSSISNGVDQTMQRGDNKRLYIGKHDLIFFGMELDDARDVDPLSS